MAAPYMLASPIPAPVVPLGGQLVAPAPFADVERRIVELAELAGVVAAPRFVSARYDAGQAGQTIGVVDLIADGTEGPIFVLGLQFPARFGEARLQLQSGARRLIEGQEALIAEVITTPRALSHSFHAPIVVLRDDALTVTVDVSTLANPQIVAGEAVSARCLVLRSRDGERLGAVADEIAAAIMAEGEFYAAAVSMTPDTADSVQTQNLNDDAIIEHAILRLENPQAEGVTAATRAWASIGNYDVVGREGLYRGDTDRQVWMPSLRYPVRRGQRIEVRGEWPAAAVAWYPVRFTVLGRRTIGASPFKVR